MEENKGFKMKGASLYGKLNLNRGGQSSMADGRAGSSALQMNDEKNGVPKKNKKGQPSESTGQINRDYEAEELVGEIGDEINFLEEDYSNDRVSKSQYDAKMKILREKERVAIEANKK